MASNVLKRPLADSLNSLTRQNATDQLAKLGFALPCQVTDVNGSIVDVSFLVNIPGVALPTITVPVLGPEWIRYPIQRGDLGFTIPGSAYLGGVSGLGGGTAGPWQPANMSALVFAPVGNANWSAPLDGGKLQLYGKTGVIIESVSGGHYKITVTEAGITISMPSNGNLTINGLPTADPGNPGELWNNAGVVSIG